MESTSMLCPKCHADKWCQGALHDPWTGRPVIACSACGEYADYDCASRNKALALIAGVLSVDLSEEHQGSPRVVAGKILDALEKAGLTIARTETILTRLWRS
ncbi:hypothetical protein ACVWYQ_003107 [Bradyrhizobium sp. USDA 3397]